MPYPAIDLSTGATIPQLGFGVFQIEPADTVAAVGDALAVGYRHIDTAQGYRNEREVGIGLAQSGLDPDSVFVTSKLSNSHLTYDDARQAIHQTVQDLAGKVPDLFLVHWPLPAVRDFMVVWRALEDAYEKGSLRAIGVSNFQIHHLERLLEQADVAPVVNQIELHPYLTQQPLRDFHDAHGIVTEAWSPIAQGAVLDDPAITAIADRLGRTPAQVVLRWHLNLGNVVFPKSVHPDRIRENFDIFDIALTPQDVDTISALNRDQRTGADPDTFRFPW